jgi:hypothetical protein
MSSDLCDAQSQHPDTVASGYAQEVLAPNSAKWRRSMLHLADVSTFCQKFDVAQQWAAMAVEEILMQGDDERKHGLAVSPLRDREKVTVASGQMQMMQSIVAPLVVSTIYIFPMLHPAAAQMLENMEEWQKAWSKEPGSEEAAAQQADKISNTKNQLAKFLPQSAAKPGEAPAKFVPAKATALMPNSGNTINLAGTWTCTNTWGLEDFLKSTGVGWAKRKAAMSAPWPTWEFQQSGDHIVFINNSAMGVLREEINASGEPFTITDGWKQKVQCIAKWDNRALIIEKEAPQGKFKETRSIDEKGALHFSLEPIQPPGPKWGRDFARKKK